MWSSYPYLSNTFLMQKQFNPLSFSDRSSFKHRFDEQISDSKIAHHVWRQVDKVSQSRVNNLLFSSQLWLIDSKWGWKQTFKKTGISQMIDCIHSLIEIHRVQSIHQGYIFVLNTSHCKIRGRRIKMNNSYELWNINLPEIFFNSCLNNSFSHNQGLTRWFFVVNVPSSFVKNGLDLELT